MKNKKESTFVRLLNDWPVKLLSLGVAVLLFMFHKNIALEERNFSVPLEIRIADGFVPAGAFPRSARVNFRGDEDQLYLILEEDVDAYVDFTEYQAEGVFRAPVRVVRRGTALHAQPLEVKVEPAEVSLTVEAKAVRRLEVRPNIEGFPKKGYEVTSTLVSPENLLVEGPRSRVDNLTVLNTRSVLLEGRDRDFSLRTELALDDDTLVFPEGRIVDVHLGIQETVLIRTFDGIEILAIDLDPGLSLRTVPGDGSIKIQGRQLDLERIKPEDVLLTVDCSAVRMPGVYTLPVKSDVPRSLVVLSREPAVVEFEIIETSGEGR